MEDDLTDLLTIIGKSQQEDVTDSSDSDNNEITPYSNILVTSPIPSKSEDEEVYDDTENEEPVDVEGMMDDMTMHDREKEKK